MGGEKGGKNMEECEGLMGSEYGEIVGWVERVEEDDGLGDRFMRGGEGMGMDGFYGGGWGGRGGRGMMVEGYRENGMGMLDMG